MNLHTNGYTQKQEEKHNFETMNKKETQIAIEQNGMQFWSYAVDKPHTYNLLFVWKSTRCVPAAHALCQFTW